MYLGTLAANLGCCLDTNVPYLSLLIAIVTTKYN